MRQGHLQLYCSKLFYKHITNIESTKFTYQAYEKYNSSIIDMKVKNMNCLILRISRRKFENLLLLKFV